MNWLAMILGAIVAWIIILPIKLADIYNEKREYWELKLTWEPWMISTGLAILAFSILGVL